MLRILDLVMVLGESLKCECRNAGWRRRDVTSLYIDLSRDLAVKPRLSHFSDDVVVRIRGILQIHRKL